MDVPGNTITNGWEAVHTLSDLGRLHPSLPDICFATNYGGAISVHPWGGIAEIREWALAFGSPVRTTEAEQDGRRWLRHQVFGTHGPSRLGIQVFSLEDLALVETQIPKESGK